MKYNVFTDFHHASLLNSLIMLFEGRLGGKVYRPIGMEWAQEGFWKVYDHPATQAQFLSLNQGYRPIDGTQSVNQIIPSDNPDVYFCRDIDSGEYNRAITLETFKKMPIDIVIASIPQHIEPFKALIDLYKPGAKLIYQVGNSWTINDGYAPNIMASAIVNGVPSGTNFITYHQEFDLHNFCPNVGVPDKNVYSFVNCFNIQDHLSQDWQLFQEVERLLPDWTFRSYGGQCRDGAAHGSKELASKMQEAKFIWHTKRGGDGYGHCLFNSAAVGRPIIAKRQYYENKLGYELMLDRHTCISIDNMTPEEIAKKINYYSEPDRYSQMCRNVYQNFKSIVDFDKEELEIRAFLERLV
jgi:hypothetical protein